MTVFESHRAWLSFQSGEILEVVSPQPRIKVIDDATKKRLRTRLIGAQLQWIDSWGPAASIRTSGYDYALQLIPDRIALRNITCDWLFDWDVEYIFYCRADDGTDYEKPAGLTAKGVRINDLTEIVYEIAKPKAEAVCNPKHIYDQGWKATLLG